MNNRELYARAMQCMTQPLNGQNLRTIFLLLAQAHYSDPKNYGYLEEALGCLVYDGPNNANSRLFVELTQEYDIHKFARRPAVYVGFDQPFQFKKLDMGHQQDGTSDNSGKDLGFIVTNVLSLIHIASDIDTALLLADSSASFFLGIRDSIRNRLQLLSFEPLTISPPALFEKAPERFFRVDVQFALSYNYTVHVNIESHRLKKFAMEFNGIAS